MAPQQTAKSRVLASPGFGLAIRIGVVGGAVAGVTITIEEVVKYSIAGNPTAGEAGIAIWVLPPLLALVGLPLGLVGRLVAVVIGLRIDGAVRGAAFGLILGIALASLILAFAYDGGPDWASAMISLVVGYAIAGALVGRLSI